MYIYGSENDFTDANIGKLSVGCAPDETAPPLLPAGIGHRDVNGNTWYTTHLPYIASPLTVI